MIFNNKILLISILLFTSLHATTIVLIRNENGIFIGADSRIVNEHGQNLGAECKVMKINDYYFTHAGLGIDSTFGFNIKDIARKVFSTHQSYDEQIDEFISEVEIECSAYLHRIKSKRQHLYSRLINGHVNIETAIAGVNESGTPFFDIIKFTAAGSENEIKISMPVRYSCPGDCQGGQAVVMLGQMSHAEGAVERRAFGMMRRPVQAINFLINKEIENNDRVGPPITILHISPHENSWIQNGDACDEAQQR